MIVVCSTCQARFKVADDKIGPRGAKVRCSKCQTVFVVHRELGVVPDEAQQGAPAAPPSPAGGVDLDLEGPSGAGVRPNGFSGNPFARSAAADPFAAAPPPQQPAADPFGAADPFAAQPAPPPPAADPFGAQDPFAANAGGGFGAVDPFVATVASQAPGLPTSAVTDLSDLLGGASPPPEPSPEPLPPPPAPEPSGILDTGFDFDDSGAAEQGSASLASGPPSPGLEAVSGADLALDERTPAPGLPAAPIHGFGEVDPFEDSGAAPAPPAAASASFADADFDAFGDDAGSAEPPPPPAPQRGTPAPAREPSSPAIAAPAPADGEPAVETTGEVAAAAGFKQPSRARAVAVNAISLVALLAVVLGLLALWRGVRPGAGGLLRPSEMLGSVGGGAPTPFATSQLRSGIFERPDAPPLLFVAGTALSHAPAPVAGLRVSVEVVRRGAVVARGEARAGPAPTPEDLAGFRDAASFAAELARKGVKPPPSVKPGDALPFLVAIADFPADVAGAELRVKVEPATAEPAAPPPEPAPVAPPAAPAPASPEGAAKP